MYLVDSKTPEFAGHFVPMAKRPSAPTAVEMIAERLRLTRAASGLNQAAWCRLVGINPQAWNNYEQARNRISLDQALRICSATGVTLDWIYRGIAAGLPISMASEIQRLDRDRRRA
jgi:transcriptional regulator with XRE-family HTH domain